MQISLRRMRNGSWRWQTNTGKNLSIPMPDDIGGGIYGPDAIDYPTAVEATEAAMKWIDAKDNETVTS